MCDKQLKRFLLMLCCIGLSILFAYIDQALKETIVTFFVTKQAHEFALSSWLNLVLIYNHGISFGLLNNLSMDTSIIFSVLALAVVIGLLIWLYLYTSFLRLSAFSLIIGGALGNVIDRLKIGAVVDFIDVHLLGYHWPAFNLADTLICIGTFVLLMDIQFLTKNNE